MQRIWVLFAVVLAAAILPLDGVRAQSNCAAALIRDKGQLDVRESSSLAAARLLRDSSSSSEDWSGGITVPVYGVPVSGSASDSRKSMRDYLENTTLSWSHDRDEKIATQVLSLNAVEAYKACLHSNNRNDVSIFVYDATRTAVTVAVRWNSPPGAATEASADFTVQGGSLNQLFPVRWRTGTTVVRIITRQPHEDLRILANIAGDAASEFVPYIPDPPIHTPHLLIGSCIGKGGLEGVRLWGPSSEFCNGIIGWGQYDAQVQAVAALGACKGHGGPEGVTLYGPIGQPCGGMPNDAWGKYVGAYPVLANGIANCTGRGNILEGHLLWGPRGEDCGGFRTWGVYSQAVQLPR